MLALYTGARLNELCQLLVNDIKFDGDIRLRKFRRKVRVNHKSKRKYIPIKVPEIMDLNENFESTVSFFLKLRDICDDDKKRFFLDFKQLKHISPAAALAFTAEIDRVRKVIAPIVISFIGAGTRTFILKFCCFTSDLAGWNPIRFRDSFFVAWFDMIT